MLHWRPLTMVGFALALPLTLAVAQPAPAAGGATAPPDGTPRRGVTDRAELEAFLDGLMGAEMARLHVAGGVVAVVKDGALFFSKGYGYADFPARKPVDPARTLFRPGSVSKLFTWTAVMQLVEQGKIDLDRDVNSYLDFKIPATFPEPITMRHLMTHTLGVEDDARDLITEDSTRIRPMSEWLPAHMPKRVRPPGVLSSYSNWGTAVAGHIVELVSGEPFSDYIQKHILDPLGMQHASAYQPLPPSLAPDMSRGYEWSGGRWVAHPFEYLPGAAPAGVMSASAEDMARFMIAHLRLGQLGDQRILSEATARQMQTRAFGHDDRLPGFALGFYQKSSHGLRIIGHGGDSQWFHTDLALIPAERLGVFVSFNTNTGGAISADAFLDDFLDHYYPDPPVPVTPPEDFARQAGRFAGSYQSDRRSFSTYLKALALTGADVISVGDSGTLLRSGSGGPTRYVQIAPLLFRNVAGPELLAFRQDSSGRITDFFDNEPMIAYERQAWYQNTRLHLVILGVSIVLFLGVLFAAVKRLFVRPPEPAPASVRLGRRLLAGAALANLISVVAALILASDFTAIVFGSALGKIELALAFPIIGLILTAGAAYAAIRQWRERAGPTGARLRFTVLVLVAVLFAWSLNQWNLLGWKL